MSHRILPGPTEKPLIGRNRSDLKVSLARKRGLHRPRESKYGCLKPGVITLRERTGLYRRPTGRALRSGEEDTHEIIASKEMQPEDADE